MLAYSTTKYGGVKHTSLAPSDCIVDYPMEKMAPLNRFFQENEVGLNWLIMIDSFMGDLSFFLLFMFWIADILKASTFLIVAILQSFTKCYLIQGYMMQMSRQKEGHLWSFPGMHALLAHYFDTDDFYFSGHMAMAAMYFYCFFQLKEQYKNTAHAGLFRFLSTFYCTFKIAYVGLMMLTTKGHYSIDLTSGFCFGILACIFAEHLLYGLDVLVFGKKAGNRGLLVYKACSNCGWIVKKGLELID